MPGETLLALGGNILAQALNNQAQGAMNQQQVMQYEAIYNKQRMDALADWNMQNQYNSPQEQMRRLKDAGLNPNLVYGSGAVANNAAPIKQSNAPAPNIAPMRVDPNTIGEAVNTYFNVMRQKQEIDNLKKQNELMEANKNLSILKGVTEGVKPENLQADTRNKSGNTYLSWQKAQQNEQLFPTQLAVAKATLAKIQQDTQTSIANELNLKSKTLSENQLRDLKKVNLTEQYMLMHANRTKSEETIPNIRANTMKLVKEILSGQTSGGINLGQLGKFGFEGKNTFKNSDVDSLYKQLRKQ